MQGDRHNDSLVNKIICKSRRPAENQHKEPDRRYELACTQLPHPFLGVSLLWRTEKLGSTFLQFPCPGPEDLDVIEILLISCALVRGGR